MQNQCSWLSQIVRGWYVIFAYIIFIGIFFIGYLVYQLPDVQQLPSIKWPLPMYIYTHDEELIAEYGPRQHQPLTIEEIPILLRQAFFATEDRRFLEHSGVDIRGLLRAAVKLLATGRKSQGGSTITMQMARNYYLTSKKSFLRKFKEILLAIKLERVFTKEQILEFYLNRIYMGHRTFGLGAAVKFYFDKPLEQLSLSEMALLAGMPQAPAILNPITNLEATKKRRDFVLSRLYQTGFINQKDYRRALEEEIVLPIIEEHPSKLRAPYVSDMAQEILQKIVGDHTDRIYHVYTTIDKRTQQLADFAILTSLLEYDQRYGYRGPEKHLNTLQIKSAEDMLSILKRLPIINGLQPAVVLSCNAEYISVFLATGDSMTITSTAWEWILKDKKDLISSYVKKGDIIRIYQQEDIWYIGQIPNVQSALVALDPNNGAIKALSGGFSYTFSQFNRATQATRQTGSSFKPFIYAAALEKGYNLSDVFNDAPLVFDMPGQALPWRPQNVNQSFHGLMRLRVALVTSVNLVTIRLLQAVGIPYTLEAMKRYGFNIAKWPKNLSLALGSMESTPLEMAGGYAIFANGGYLIKPYLIDRITDAQGKLVYQANPPRVPPKEIPSHEGKSVELSDRVNTLYAPRVLSEEVAFLITSTLKGVIPYSGWHITQSLERKDLAGKTGTTNDTVDNWFIGYRNNYLVSSVWMGRDKRQPLREYAYTTALPLWIKFMKSVLQDIPDTPEIKPKGVVILPINPDTGLPVRQASRNTIYEYFQTASLDRYKSLVPVSKKNVLPVSSEEPLF